MTLLGALSRAASEKNAGQVDRAEPSSLGETGCSDILTEKQTSIVDQDAELAEAVEGGGDHGLPILPRWSRRTARSEPRRPAFAPPRGRVRRAFRRSRPWRQSRASAAWFPRRCRALLRISGPPCRETVHICLPRLSRVDVPASADADRIPQLSPPGSVDIVPPLAPPVFPIRIAGRVIWAYRSGNWPAPSSAKSRV